MKQKITKQKLYKRQTTLKEIGKVGQNKLQNTKVLVVGCGGLGCVAAVYLASSGVGKIHLIDFDLIDQSNLHRQVFYKTTDLKQAKAKILAKHILSITPFVNVSFNTKAVSKKNVFTIIENYDIILDCTDNLPIKYLLNDACVIKNKVLIYGSLYKFDGYVATFNAFKNEERTANLRDAFPKIPKKTVPNCSEIGTLNTIVGIIGLMQANEVLKLVTQTGKPLINQILIYNSLENSQYKMKLKKVFTIKMIKKIYQHQTYQNINCETQNTALLITAKTLKNKLNTVKIISVIEDIETKLPFNVDIKIPYSKLEVNKLNFEKTKTYVIVCNKGISSYRATIKIKEKNPKLNVFSLNGGIGNY